MTPINGMVEIEQIKSSEVTAGGIILPNPEETSSRIGRVVAIPADMDILFVKKGDLVAFHASAAREVFLNGKRHWFIHKGQIIAFEPYTPAPVN